MNKFTAWFIGKRHMEKKPHQVAMVSYGSDLAETNSKMVLGAIQDPLYKNVFPKLTLANPYPTPKKWSLRGGGSLQFNKQREKGR